MINLNDRLTAQGVPDVFNFRLGNKGDFCCRDRDIPTIPLYGGLNRIAVEHDRMPIGSVSFPLCHIDGNAEGGIKVNTCLVFGKCGNGVLRVLP